MFGLAIGVSKIGESLPRAVYALLSGLNAATVGIIALAAVQLAQKAITDKLTRSLVFLGAAAGLLYNALWYFPLLMLAAGLIAVVHDYRWLHGPVKAVAGLPGRVLGRKKKKDGRATEKEDGIRMSPSNAEQMKDNNNNNHVASSPSATAATAVAKPASVRTKKSIDNDNNDTRQRLPISNQEAAAAANAAATAEPGPNQTGTLEEEERTIPPDRRLAITWKSGLALILLFLASFTVVMILRGVLPSNPLLYKLFANMYLAGTIIFGGGPVVIPLLREYVVAEGWVSPRDFLIGLALIQGFPGPNFNFAVYLGGLTAINGGYPAIWGALLGYVGMFVPGLVTVHGTMGVWSALRGLRWVRSALRGVNAGAVGLIYTAVYRLWQIGWIDEGFQQGTSLANDPWWVVVTAASYVGGCWYGVSPPVACVFGAVLGLVRYGVVSGQGL